MSDTPERPMRGWTRWFARFQRWLLAGLAIGLLATGVLAVLGGGSLWLLLVSGVMTVLALLMAFSEARRISRDPVVVRSELHPAVVRDYDLKRLLVVDAVLKQAHRAESTLTAAGISQASWNRVLGAARSPDSALEACAEALGARLGEPLLDGELAGHDITAHALTLPELRLRFDRESALAAVFGPALEDGAATALAEAIHRRGEGPTRALVLDLTDAQNARRRLGDRALVQFVVLSSDALRDLLLADEPMRELEAALVEQIGVSALSPYRTAGGVEEDILFFGREAELRAMTDRSWRSFLVVGARQMGKSSVLKALRRRLAGRADVEVHYLTLQGDDIVAELARRDHGAVPGVSADDLFRRLAAGTRERPRLWLLDEADLFVREDEARGCPVTRLMRTLSEEGVAFFVLAGFWHLYEAAVLGEHHPLRNFGEIIHLGPLDEVAARRLATEPMAALGLAWDSPETIDALIDGAGRRANLIVLACKAVLAELDRETRVITRERLERAVRDTALDLAAALRGILGIHDDPLEQALLRQALVLGWPTAQELRASLRELGLTAPVREVERALDRLRLGYVLIERDDRLECPVPFLQAHIERRGDLGAYVRDVIEDWKAGRERA